MIKLLFNEILSIVFYSLSDIKTPPKVKKYKEEKITKYKDYVIMEDGTINMIKHIDIWV